MASRNPRIKPPVLTKTQALRQAKSAAFVKEYEQKQQVGKPEPQAIPGRRRRYPVAEPKKVEFTRPAMTKTQLARMKHAEKFKQEYERKREEEMMPTRRVPRRPPISGDPRSEMYRGLLNYSYILIFSISTIIFNVKNFFVAKLTMFYVSFYQSFEE